MAILKRMGSILVTGAAAAAVITLGASSAFAAAKVTTWTITPGGAFTVKAASATLTDDTSNNSLNCTGTTTSPSLKFKSTLKSGTGLAGAKIGKITGVTFAHCSVDGFAVTMTATLPWHINLTSPTSTAGTVNGTITGIKAVLAVSAVGCTGNVGGKVAGSGGSIAFTYTNPTTSTGAGTLTISPSTTTSKLFASNVNGCLGVVNNGDQFSISATASTTHQVITTP
ncbi:MAG TPA: hypothetical protein VGS19_26270 [Streptosporangiaceae bacterium]|nr:hypothetical protein [Streptosporangiaceae bacterium]